MARVQVSDEIWTAFRFAIGTTPVSVALGRLVEREVASRRRRSAVDPDSVRAVVAEARVVADELGELIARLETVHGTGLKIDELQPVNDLSFR